MKNFRITYRMEVIIQAETEAEAQDIFERTDLEELSPEFVEQVSFEEEF